MQSATGTILLVQESRFRLLAEDGTATVFVLSHDAPIEPQDLPPLTGRRVQVAYEAASRLVASVAHDVLVLDGEPRA